MSDLLLRGGRIIDPATGRDEIGNLLVVDGRFAAPGTSPPDQVETIDATGLVVSPGLIDIHVHFREPGQTGKETIASGSRAAAAGGFTSVVCMPNTSPTIDHPSVVADVLNRAQLSAVVNVFVSGALTKNIAGEDLAPIGSMHRQGIVAVTDDGHCIQNHELMRRAVEYSRMFGLTVMDHCQDYNLVGNGVMHEGYWSTVLGLPGWPSAGEELMVMRNVLLAELCDSPIHCQHLSSRNSVRLIKEGRSRGVKISGEICPHHIALTAESLRSFDTNYKMNPPLRASADVMGLIEGIADDTVTILASDHAPHCAYEKEVEFDQAPFGIVGLETEFGLFSTLLLHKHKALDLPRLIEKLTVNPARLLGLDRGTLTPGAPADITVIDPGMEWTVDKEQFASQSRNTPFDGWQLTGRAVRTIVAGKTVWSL